MAENSVNIAYYYLTNKEIDYELLPGFYTNSDGSLKNNGYPSFNSMPDTIPLEVEYSGTLMPSINIDKNDSYPSFSTQPDLKTLKAQVPPFPKMIPILNSDKNDSYPSFSTQPDLKTLKAQSPPFPKMIPGLLEDVCDNYPTFSTLPDLKTLKSQVPPFPKMMPKILEDICDNYPNTRGEEAEFGAGSNSLIEEVEIPYSVTYISDYAFYNSNIKSVKINRHCIYFAHSFPPGCHIKPYNDK